MEIDKQPITVIQLPGKPPVNRQIFRMYDIRGVVHTDITPDIVNQIGAAYGTYIRQIYNVKPRIAVGRDNRVSSPALHRAVCEGLMESGCEVINIGLSTTPLLCYAIIDWHLDGGINVTGSHNPPNQNGLKLEARNAYPIAEHDIQYIRKIVENRLYYSGTGSIVLADPADDYISRLSSIVHLERRLKVVVDAGNGVAGLFAPRLLVSMGCDVIPLHCELDDTFPNHWPNPENPANMKDLQHKVLKEKADVGIAFDGDGDRLGIVDDTGRIFNADLMIILLARDLLTRYPGAKVIIDVKSSQNVIEDIYRHGGEPILWKTGHSLIRRKMLSDGILLAGEFSGHLFPAEDYYPVSDALLSALRILNILSKQEQPLSRLLTDLKPLYSTGLIELDCPDNYKFEVVESLKKSLARHYDLITVDGIRISFSHGWALIRASNTSESLTLRFEADSLRRLDEIQAIVYHRLEEFPLFAGGNNKRSYQHNQHK